MSPISSFVPTEEENTRRRSEACRNRLREHEPIVRDVSRATARSLDSSRDPAHDDQVARSTRKRTVSIDIGIGPSTMKIHEYQAKAILAQHGVPVPQGEVVFTAAEAARRRRAARRRHGRRQGADSRRRPRQGRRRQGRQGRRTRRAQPPQKILGMHAGHPPDRAAGPEVQRVLIEQGLKIERELYLGIVIDRATERPGADGQSGRRRRDREGRRKRRPSGSSRSSSTRGIGLSAYQARQAGVRARASRARGRAGRQDDDGALRRLHGDRRVAGRDQSARS